jgi:integrase
MISRLAMGANTESCEPAATDIASRTATPRTTPKRGPVPRRRFQKGSFLRLGDSYYSMFYQDTKAPDGTLVTKQVKRCLGAVIDISERAARREHARIMEAVNQKRGSIAPVLHGQTFAEAVERWRTAIAPNLSPATVRPREYYLRGRILPRFGKINLADIGVHELQTFATELRGAVSGKTVFQILATIFGIMKYAAKCGARVPDVSFKDLELGTIARERPVAFFTRSQVGDIIGAAREPFKTLFAVAWFTGMRAGEILALTVDDLNFTDKTIRVNKSTDDSTRKVRQPKTKASIAQLPMPTALETHLRNYLMLWKPNPAGILFPTKDGTRSRSRDNVVRVGLKPVLKRLGLPMDNVGLHAFRHGLATQLAESSVPLTVLQSQLRHADVKTTLRVYSHVIPQTQRDAMEQVSPAPIVTNSITLLRRTSK